MAYRVMIALINGGRKDRETLLNYADVYYGAGRLTDEQYQEIVALIEEKYPVTEE